MGFWQRFAEMVDKASGRLVEISQASLLKGEILWLEASMEEALQKIGEEVVAHWQMTVASPEVQRLVAHYHLALVVRYKKEEELLALERSEERPLPPKLKRRSPANRFRDLAWAGIYGPRGEPQVPHLTGFPAMARGFAEQARPPQPPAPQKNREELRREIEEQKDKVKKTLVKIGRLFAKNRFFADQEPFQGYYAVLDKANARLVELEKALARLRCDDGPLHASPLPVADGEADKPEPKGKPSRLPKEGARLPLADIRVVRDQIRQNSLSPEPWLLLYEIFAHLDPDGRKGMPTLAPDQYLKNAIEGAKLVLKNPKARPYDEVLLGKAYLYLSEFRSGEPRERCLLLAVNHIAKGVSKETDSRQRGEYYYYLALAYREMGNKDLWERSLNLSRKLLYPRAMEEKGQEEQ